MASYTIGQTRKISYGLSDFEAIYEMLKEYGVPEDVVEKVIAEMWRRGDGNQS